jgi:hypothetical protein
MSLWSFDLGGQVFAYRVGYAEETIYNGERHELAAASWAFFYDMDGSKNFTVLDGGKGVSGHSIGFLPSFIPEWVKSRTVAQPTK